MSELRVREDRRSGEGIGDDQLPDDLVPSDDNPLAEPLAEDEVDVDDLDMGGGYAAPEQTDDEDARGLTSRRGMTGIVRRCHLAWIG